MVSSNYTTVKSSMEGSWLSKSVVKYIFSVTLSILLHSPESPHCLLLLCVFHSLTFYFLFEGFVRIPSWSNQALLWFWNILSNYTLDNDDRFCAHLQSGYCPKFLLKKSYLWSILFLLSVSWNYSISHKFSHFFTWIDVLRFTSSHLSSSCPLRFGFSQSPLHFNVATCTVVNSPSAGSFIPLSEDPEKGVGGG